ncbi:MAG TPA: hypothetical protein VNN73_15460 [Blastocatellia bacterium]|nr:hypothetical protein [Blastocatellia bacterium]
MLRPNPATPEDAATMARYNLTQMRGRIQQSLAGGTKLGVVTRAHLQESIARIDEALKAQQQRVLN